MLNSLSSNPIFEKMSPEKKQILNELAESSNGIPINKSMPLLLKTTAKMKTLGISFTKEESSLLLDALSSGMSPDEQLKFTAMKNILSKHMK